MRAVVFTCACLLMSTAMTPGQTGERWVTTWAASPQGPYPSGNPSAQPDQRFTFPVPSTGARDQTFRLMVRPGLWGPRMRIRLSNVFGAKPVVFADVHLGVQEGGATVLAGTNRPVHFSASDQVAVPVGTAVWSDPIDLPFVTDRALFDGRKLAVTFRVVGESGPMTWHAKALQTSYLTAPGAESVAGREDEALFPFSTTSWYFLDAVDVMAPADTRVVVAFGDSITDGTSSTLNGDDRWPDALSRRLRARYGSRVVVINAGIGGNQILGPATYAPAAPVSGGPSAGQRLDRDVLSLSGVSAVIWLEGINDLSRTNNATVEAITNGMGEVVRRLRATAPTVQVIGATVLSALGSTNGAHGSPEQDVKRQALNAFIRTSGLFDHVADFDAATVDPATGQLRPEFVPDSTTGGAGDRLHPNRAGYLAMAHSIDLDWFR